MIVAQPGTRSSSGRHDSELDDLSTRSSSQSNSPSPTSSNEKNLGTHLLQALHGQFPSRDLSPLQRLQFAFERTSILSNLFTTDTSEDQDLGPSYRGRAEERRVSSPDQNRKVPSPDGSPRSDPADIFDCPLCAFPCNGRHAFNEHLVTHSQHHACPKCDYLTDNEDKLKDHLGQEHDMGDRGEGMDEEEVTVPKLNAQGKVKTFKCKQCEHMSLTKSESWAHAGTHIRPEKMLKCPKCPFVTEYKHHLEYHLRIHVGSKPYQCNVCSYTCVNKSMLNSHLKSHSAVYQYNCLDCDYQTKYCHSLKMHLRKLNHRPSMVLNPDGTPNPLPIIDVYGTRRGPKMKKNQPITSNVTPKPAIRIPPNEFVLSPGNNSQSSHSYSSQGSPDSVNPVSPRVKVEPAGIKTKGKLKQGLAQAPMRGQTEPMAKSGSDSETEKFQRQFEPKPEPGGLGLAKNPLELYAVLNQYLFSNPLLIDPEHLARMTGRPPFLRQADTSNMDYDQASSPTALDLRHPKVESERRRRKGKAHRYDRRQAYEDEDDCEMALDFSNNNGKGPIGCKIEPEPNFEDGRRLMCNHCDISFVDRVLYKMHMGYHSSGLDPFLCKSCGKKTQDKISFCLHLTTDSH